jgi:hypothetical protein
VADEIAAALRRTGAGDRVAILGCGAVLPAGAEHAEVADFDSELLEQAVAGSDATGHHAIGARTVLGDQSVDVVIVTSRLAGLWERWGDSIRAEAHRIGRTVDIFADHSDALS